MNNLLRSSLLVFLAACSLDSAPPRNFSPPPAGKVPLTLCWLETAGTTAPGGAATAGWTRASKWEVTTSALLVRHPSGDFLIDTGMSAAPSKEARELSAWGRFVFSQTAGRNERRGDLRALLATAGVDPSKLKGVILSHAHPDHAGGVAELPGVPIYVAPEEHELVQRQLATHGHVVLPAQARALLPQMKDIPFVAKPFANYERSWDVFGDGSLVVVPTFGHTPGSVGTFVTSATRRLVHVGDLISLQESLARDVPKSKLMRALTDEDEAATNLQVAKLVQLHRADPLLVMLPAHDRNAWASVFGAVPAPGSPRCVQDGR